MCYINGELFTHNEWFNYVTCQKMDGIWSHHSDHHKSISKNKKSHGFGQMWNLGLQSVWWQSGNGSVKEISSDVRPVFKPTLANALKTLKYFNLFNLKYDIKFISEWFL
jgi:hypothetical protein